jgi:hypothetical protein
VISSGRSFKSLSAPHEFLSQSFQSSAHARVRTIRARLQDDPADELRVDAARCVDFAAGRLLDLIHDRIRFLVGQLAGRDQLHVEAALFARDQTFELLRDLLKLARALLLGDEVQEVLEQWLVVAGEVGEDARLRRRVELRIP